MQATGTLLGVGQHAQVYATHAVGAGLDVILRHRRAGELRVAARPQIVAVVLEVDYGPAHIRGAFGQGKRLGFLGVIGQHQREKVPFVVAFLVPELQGVLGMGHLVIGQRQVERLFEGLLRQGKGKLTRNAREGLGLQDAAEGIRELWVVQVVGAGNQSFYVDVGQCGRTGISTAII